jgi:hypothetical protein
MKPRTPAEQQMEELRQLRETLSKRKPTAAPRSPNPGAAKPAATQASVSGGSFELSEPVAKKKKEGPSLPLSPALYRQLLQRQREGHAFRRRKDLGDWAAALALALPFEAHKLSDDAKAELFQRMQDWARARGLR